MTRERDTAASMEARVVEEFRRTGIVPAGLLTLIQASAWKRGSAVTLDEVERFAREWCNGHLATHERRARPVPKSEPDVERALDVLTGFSPRQRPEAWSEAIAVVQLASRDGRLTAAQTAQLDTLDAIYASKV